MQDREEKWLLRTFDIMALSISRAVAISLSEEYQLISCRSGLMEKSIAVFTIYPSAADCRLVYSILAERAEKPEGSRIDQSITSPAPFRRLFMLGLSTFGYRE